MAEQEQAGFTCDEAAKVVTASSTAVLTIDGSNPTFVQVYIRVAFLIPIRDYKLCSTTSSLY